MRILLTFFIISSLQVSAAWSLTVGEALTEALQNNPQIARAEALTQAASARTGKQRAPFWPTLGVDYSYWEADRDPNLATSDLSSASAYARINLFNGGSDWFRLDAADARKEAAEWQQKSIVADIILATRQAYIEVLRAEQSLATTRQSMELLEQQYRQAELRFEQGLIARNDLLRIAVEKATAQQGVVSTEGALVVTRQELARVMGRALEKDETLATVSLNEQQPGAEEELSEAMLSSRSELKYLQSLLVAQSSDRKAVYGDLLPDVNLSHSYDRFGNRTFPDSDDTNYDKDSITMLQASWTLFSGFDTRHELAVRKHEMTALKEEIRSTEDLLRVQLTKALEDYRVAQTNLDTARTSLTLAEENYRVNENRYKAQVATTVDLLDAREFLTRTRNEEVKALYDLYKAEAVIDRVLERAGP